MTDEEIQEVIKWFRYIAPEYANTSDDEVKIGIEFAEPLVSKKQFKDFYTRALAYMCAHKMKWRELYIANGSDGMAVTAGQATSQREGDLSLSYGSTSNGSNGFTDDLDKTIYGVEFKRLRLYRIIPVMTRYG